MKKHTNSGFRTPPLFSYRSGNSIIHRAPALLKIVLLCIISIRTFSSFHAGIRCSPTHVIPWLRAAFYGSIVLISFITAKTPPSSLRRLSFVPVLGLLITLLKIMPETAEELFDYSLNIPALLEGLLYTVRLFITTAAALITFETTSRLQLYSALDAAETAISRIFPPIKKLHAAEMLAVTISFIPEIFNSWNNITLAARARTPPADKKRIRITQHLKTAGAVFSALFYSLMQYAAETRKAVNNRM